MFWGCCCCCCCFFGCFVTHPPQTCDESPDEDKKQCSTLKPFLEEDGCFHSCAEQLSDERIKAYAKEWDCEDNELEKWLGKPMCAKDEQTCGMGESADWFKGGCHVRPSSRRRRCCCFGSTTHPFFGVLSGLYRWSERRRHVQGLVAVHRKERLLPTMRRRVEYRSSRRRRERI